jgi:hypothetical protein
MLRCISGVVFAIFLLFTPSSSALIRIQFDADLGAGSYSGTEAPGHAAGDFGPADTTWNSFSTPVASPNLKYADGTTATGVSLQIGEILNVPGYPNVWSNPWYSAYTSPSPTPQPLYDNAMARDVLYADGWEIGLAVGVMGLPAGSYRLYIIPLVAEALERTYSIYSGTNLIPDPYPTIDLSPLGTPTPVGDANVSSWIAGRNYVVTPVLTTSSTTDMLTFVVAGPLNPALAGFQIVEVVIPEPASLVGLAFGGLVLLQRTRR